MTDLIEIAETKISNSNKLTIIAGLNVLEDDQQTVEVAEIPLFSKLHLIRQIVHQLTLIEDQV
jgi:3-deoxy-D-manno-octulosonic acid (KDO) 8-phosphate synthase